MEPLSNEAMSRILASMIGGKSWWLRNFSDGRSKRPDHEIEQKREELQCLKQAHKLFTVAANRSEPVITEIKD
jgi:hypothetical protein